MTHDAKVAAEVETTSFGRLDVILLGSGLRRDSLVPIRADCIAGLTLKISERLRPLVATSA